MASYKSGTVSRVTKLPKCDFDCVNSATYDFKTKSGAWGNGCTKHYKQFRAYDDLGIGKGQQLVCEDYKRPSER